MLSWCVHGFLHVVLCGNHGPYNEKIRNKKMPAYRHILWGQTLSDMYVSIERKDWANRITCQRFGSYSLMRLNSFRKGPFVWKHRGNNFLWEKRLFRCRIFIAGMSASEHLWRENTYSSSPVTTHENQEYGCHWKVTQSDDHTSFQS